MRQSEKTLGFPTKKMAIITTKTATVPSAARLPVRIIERGRREEAGGELSMS